MKEIIHDVEKITQFDSSSEVPGKRVLHIIDSVVVKDKKKHDIYVLPLMCGSGKSSGISEKIREAIKQNEGLLVITDRVKRLEDYLKPEKNEDLARDLRKHKAEIALMKQENAEKVKSTHHKYPVLLMTTQRYFRMNVDEIKEFLKWDGGTRELVLIDEKPELYTPYTLNKNMLRKLYDFIERNAELTEEKIHFQHNLAHNIQIWFDFDTATIEKPVSRKGTFYILNQEENEFDSAYYEENGKKYWLPDLRAPIEEDDTFFQSFMEGNEQKKKHRAIREIYESYHYLRQHRFLMSYRHDKDEAVISKFRSNEEKLTDIGATVIILDGTADLSIDYYNQKYMTMYRAREPERKLTDLHIRIINSQGTSRETLEKKNDISAFKEYVCAENRGTKEKCVFTFKTIQESFEADDEGEYKEDKLPPYLGNNRGRNDLQSFHVMGQVGILFSPPYRYFEHMIQQDEEWSEKLGTDGKMLDDSARIIQELSWQEKSIVLRNKDVLADIEQNVFRGPYRNPDYKKGAVYYLFFDCDKYKDLKDQIIERFGEKYYGADVSFVEKPMLLDLLKALKGNTMYSKVLHYLDKKAIGTKFSTQDIMSDPEVKFTKDQFQNARKNKIVNHLLEQFEINDHKKEKTYQKLFDLRDIDKSASKEQSELEMSNRCAFPYIK